MHKIVHAQVIENPRACAMPFFHHTNSKYAPRGESMHVVFLDVITHYINDRIRLGVDDLTGLINALLPDNNLIPELRVILMQNLARTNF